MASNGSMDGGSDDEDPGEAKIGDELEASLVELIDLGLLAKQLQWSASGPLASVLYGNLESLSTSWLRMAGQIAERSVAVGRWPDAQADAIVAGADHTTVARGPIEDQAALYLVTDCLDGLVHRVHNRRSSFGERDATSKLLLIRVASELEQQLAVLRSQFPFAESTAARKGELDA